MDLSAGAVYAFKASLLQMAIEPPVNVYLRQMYRVCKMDVDVHSGIQIMRNVYAAEHVKECPVEAPEEVWICGKSKEEENN